MTTSAEHREGVEILRVVGEIDLSTAPRLADALGRAAAADGSVVADLTEVAFMDSSGTRVLIGADRDAVERGGRLLVVPSDAVARVLEVSGLDQVLRVCADLAGALAVARGDLAH